jgi:hypothetical protein
MEALTITIYDDLASYVGGAVCSRWKVGRIAIEMTGADYREEM